MKYLKILKKSLIGFFFAIGVAFTLLYMISITATGDIGLIYSLKYCIKQNGLIFTILLITIIAPFLGYVTYDTIIKERK